MPNKKFAQYPYFGYGDNYSENSAFMGRTPGGSGVGKGNSPMSRLDIDSSERVQPWALLQDGFLSEWGTDKGWKPKGTKIVRKKVKYKDKDGKIKTKIVKKRIDETEPKQRGRTKEHWRYNPSGTKGDSPGYGGSWPHNRDFLTQPMWEPTPWNDWVDMKYKPHLGFVDKWLREAMEKQADEIDDMWDNVEKKPIEGEEWKQGTEYEETDWEKAGDDWKEPNGDPSDIFLVNNFNLDDPEELKVAKEEGYEFVSKQEQLYADYLTNTSAFDLTIVNEDMEEVDKHEYDLGFVREIDSVWQYILNTAGTINGIMFLTPIDLLSVSDYIESLRSLTDMKSSTKIFLIGLQSFLKAAYAYSYPIVINRRKRK